MYLVIVERSGFGIILCTCIRVDRPAVKDIDIPSEFVTLITVYRVSEKHTEIKRFLQVESVYGLDNCIENMG